MRSNIIPRARAYSYTDYLIKISNEDLAKAIYKSKNKIENVQHIRLRNQTRCENKCSRCTLSRHICQICFLFNESSSIIANCQRSLVIFVTLLLLVSIVCINHTVMTLPIINETELHLTRSRASTWKIHVITRSSFDPVLVVNGFFATLNIYIYIFKHYF